jgi:hypothetical protein
MKITLGQLRSIIRHALLEAGGASPIPSQPYTRNAMSPDINHREQLGKLEFGEVEDELPEHLREPELTPEECWGPVPPNDENDPGVYQDPFVRSYSPLPTPGIKR